MFLVFDYFYGKSVSMLSQLYVHVFLHQWSRNFTWCEFSIRQL